MYKLPTIVIQFANEIDTSALTHFRGAVIASLDEKSILFHNHDEDKLRYSYPLIQYKRIHKKAAVMGIGKGIEEVSQLLQPRDFNLLIGHDTVEMQIESVNAYDNEIVLSNQPVFNYQLRHWLPLNSYNYVQYRGLSSLIERIQFLEDILIGNILSFLKGIDVYLDKQEQIELHITNMTDQHTLTYKKVKLMAFDIEFKANISLPQYIGLGKNASIGCGVLTNITN